VTAPAAEGNDEGTVLAELGPFFAVRTHGARAADPEEGGTPPAAARAPWRSMGELTDGPDVLAGRVAAVRGLLAAGGGQPPEAVEPRVAASVTHLGLVARVVSPYLALAVLHGRVPLALRLADLRWQPTLGGPYPLSLPRAPDGADGTGSTDADSANTEAGADGADGAGGADPGTAGACDGLPALAAGLARWLSDGPVRELVDACAALRVSPHVLWGNVASAVNGATAMIAAARPEAAARAGELAGLLLERGALRASGSRTAAGAFRRRSCCLIYRAGPGGAGALCGDCVLSHVPARSA
jgi:hypothetical protein